MALKVFDLQCANGHVFEGWFASREDYDSQHERGLVSCPVCSNGDVVKRLSAPRLNMGHHNQTERPAQGNDGSSAPVAVPTHKQLAELQAAVLRQMRDIVRNTENVGTRFAEEARRIHEGEATERPIRGVATRDERESLEADGIAVMPIPDVFDDERMQ